MWATGLLYKVRDTSLIKHKLPELIALRLSTHFVLVRANNFAFCGSGNQTHDDGKSYMRSCACNVNPRVLVGLGNL